MFCISNQQNLQILEPILTSPYLCRDDYHWWMVPVMYSIQIQNFTTHCLVLIVLNTVTAVQLQICWSLAWWRMCLRIAVVALTTKVYLNMAFLKLSLIRHCFYSVVHCCTQSWDGPFGFDWVCMSVSCSWGVIIYIDHCSSSSTNIWYFRPLCEWGHEVTNITFNQLFGCY